MSDLNSVYKLVRRFLDREISNAELQGWLNARHGWIVDEAQSNEGKLAARVQHLCMLLSDDALDEAEVRDEVRAAFDRWSPTIEIYWHVDRSGPSVSTSSGAWDEEVIEVPALVPAHG